MQVRATVCSDAFAITLSDIADAGFASLRAQWDAIIGTTSSRIRAGVTPPAGDLRGDSEPTLPLVSLGPKLARLMSACLAADGHVAHAIGATPSLEQLAWMIYAPAE